MLVLFDIHCYTKDKDKEAALSQLDNSLNDKFVFLRHESAFNKFRIGRKATQVWALTAGRAKEL